MDRGNRFSLVLVRGDGSRVVRFSFPRRLPVIVLGVLGVMVAGLAVIAGDWWVSRGRMREVGSLVGRIDTQQATIAGLKGRVAEVNTEIATWRELHARIWESFGPDIAPNPRRTGIGGPSATDPAPSRVTPSDELERLTQAVREEGDNLRALERLMSRAGKALASLPSRWPVRGTVNSEFGGRRSPWAKRSEFHGGIDIGAERGTPVHAPAAGTVAFAGSHAEYGLTVMVEHGEDLKTIYGHLSKTLVAQGQKVARGAELGLTGNSGRSSGPHLHYEILVNGRSVNPRAYFWD